MGLAFDVYSAASPNGSLLATLTDASEKRVAIPLHGLGSGTFSLPRSSAQATAAIIAQGNIVKVRLTEVSATPIAAFFMDIGRFDLVGSDQAPEMLTFGGPGAMSYLGRAVMWNQSYYGSGNVGPLNNEWLLYNGNAGNKAGNILWRVINEAIAAGRPQHPFPSLTLNFTATTDSASAGWSSTSATAEWTAKVGDYLDVLCLRLEQDADPMVLQMSPNLVLSAYNSFGVDRHSATFASGKVRFQKGVNIATALTRELAAPRVKSHLLVAGDDGAYGGASNAVTPVREGFSTADGSDTTALNALAAQDLAARGRDADAIRLVAPYGNTPTTTGLYYPGPVGSSGHYWVGDTVTVHTGTGAHDYNESQQRIAEIDIGEDAAGQPVVELAFGSTFSTSLMSQVTDKITEQRTVVEDLTNLALHYAQSLREIAVVAGLPALPDPTFPIGAFVFLTTDGKLYRNVAGAWTKAVDGGDITANTIIANALTVGSVTSGAIAAGAVTTGKLATGAITLYDEYSQTSLTPGGFSGAWQEFISDGLYNSAFRMGSTGAVPDGRNGNLPFWTVSRSNLTSLIMVADAAWPGGRYLEAIPSAQNGYVQVTSDMVPIGSEPFVIAAVLAAVQAGSAVPAFAVYANYYDATSSFISTVGLGVANFQGSITDPANYSSGPLIPPPNARFITAGLKFYEYGAHDGGTRMRIGGGSMRVVPLLGVSPQVWPDGGGPFLNYTGTSSFPPDRAYLVPITVVSSFNLRGCFLYTDDASGSRACEWRLFYENVGSSILQEVPGANGRAAWTGSGAHIQSLPTQGAKIRPGTYWLGFRNYHPSNTMSLGRVINPNSGYGANSFYVYKNSAGDFGSTFDMSTITTQDSNALAIYLGGWAANQAFG